MRKFKTNRTSHNPRRAKESIRGLVELLRQDLIHTNYLDSYISKKSGVSKSCIFAFRSNITIIPTLKILVKLEDAGFIGKGREV